jgi:hypothetical protein
MNRSLLNLTVDLLAAVSLLVMVATGYILRFPLPPTTNRTHELWALSRHEWGTIHSWASVILLVVLGIHVALHWDWLFATIHHRLVKTKAAPGARVRAAILTLAVLITLGGLFAWVTQTSVREREIPLHPLREAGAPARPAVDAAPRPQVVDFQRDVIPIFQTSCIGCHGPDRQRANFRVDRLEDFFASGADEPLIEPRHSGKSRLIAIVSGEVKGMKSAEDHVLPGRDVEILKAWIDAGAEWSREPIPQQK